MIATFSFKPQTWNLDRLEGISNKTLEAHFKLYEGYVKNTNLLREQIAEVAARGGLKGTDPKFAGLKRRLSYEFNGMRLHELYFDNLANDPSEIDDGGGLDSGIREVWESHEKWRDEFAAMGEMRGVGWVILAQDPWSGDLSNLWIEEHHIGHILGFRPVLVMDVWEHAWMLDFASSERSKYVSAFLANVDWERCEERLRSPALDVVTA